jgi:diamine N-acetyltransferase
MNTPPETQPGADAVISLREITKETLGAILALTVADHQKRFVASNAVSIAQAHFEPEYAWFRAIYADETPVGFLMLWDDPAQAEYFLWRFMIDARYQRLGYGRQAFQQLIAHVKTRPGAKSLGVSCVPGEGSPGPFYERLGFVYTGEKVDGELVMRLTW